jgi:hypothetical protein
MYENGAHSWGTVFPGFDNGVYVAYIYYGATTKFALRECHGLMNWQAWEEFHRTIGTYRVSGGLVPGASWTANTYTTAAVTPAVDSAVINDEDLPTDIPAFADGSTYTRIHVDTGNVVFTATSTLPFPNDGTNIQYNQSPLSGTALTAITTNARFVNIYGIFVPATADATSQAYRILWMTGQQIYTTLAAAQGEDFRTLTTGNLATLFPEFVPFIRVTYERQTAGGSTTTFNARIPTNGVSYIVGTRAGLTSVTGFTPTDHNTLTGRADADSHPASAITGTAVTLAGAEALTNKTLTAPVISDFLSMTEIATPTSPSAGSLKVYPKSDDKLYTLNSAGVETPVGSGSGSSSEVNYVSNFNFEETANGATPAGWATYADAAAATPVDGTGGSPNVTFTASNASPIRGLVSGVFTKDAANRQGEGVAYAFTIPAVDKSKKVGINFDITPGGSYTSSDMSVYVYDVTNSVLITPAAVSLPNLIGTFTTSFDLTAGTSYRLILHVASTNASAYTLKIDNVSVGYKPTPQGAVVEEWKSYTPSFDGLGSVSNIAMFYRRVGGSIHIQGGFKPQAGINTNLAYFTMPSGLTVDTSKLSTINYPTSGRWYRASNAAANTRKSGNCIVGLNNVVYFGSDSWGDPVAPANGITGNNLCAAGDDFQIADVCIPIAEWAGSGTVNLAQNDVEWAYNSDTAATTDTGTANFGYGPSGVSIISSTPVGGTQISKRVRFQSPIQVGDRLELELWNGYSWGSVSVSVSTSSGLLIESLRFDGTNYIGIGGIQGVSGAPNDVYVTIGKYSAGATQPWSTVSTSKWRVRKTSAGAAVSFGQVAENSAGLFPAYNTNLDNATATRLGLKQYLHGTTYNGGNAPTVSYVSSTGFSITNWFAPGSRAVFFPYQCQDGTWRLKFNIYIKHGSTGTGSYTDLVISINGISVSFIQTISYLRGGNQASFYTSSTGAVNTNTLYASFAAGATYSVEAGFSGDVELNAKPTWAY